MNRTSSEPEPEPEYESGSGSGSRDLGALTGPAIGISFITGFGGAMALAESPFPRPGATAQEIRRYFTGSARAARLSATGQLISALSLARFTASVAALAARSDPDGRALRAAAIAGGGLAVVSLGTAAVTHAMLTSPDPEVDGRAVAMSKRVFVAGGPVHGVGFGVLTGVIGLAGLRTGDLPRPLAVTALASAVAGMLTPLYFLWEPAGWLIPIGRFSGLLVSGIVGARLSRRRRAGTGQRRLHAG